MPRVKRARGRMRTGFALLATTLAMPGPALPAPRAVITRAEMDDYALAPWATLDAADRRQKRPLAGCAEGTMSDAVTPAVAGSLHSGAGRRALRVSMVLAAFACALPARGDSTWSEDLEPVIKVEFIARFMDYVDWPQKAFAADSTFHFCAVGNGPLIPHIQNLVAKNRLKNRPADYRTLADTGEAAGCHLIYFGPDAGSDMDAIIQRLDDAPVLTIGDSPGYGKRGAMINLFLEGTHVRFKINSTAAKANGLQVSAKLLMLGKQITAGE